MFKRKGETMKTLAIEWLHYAREGETCDRCSATGTSVSTVVSELAQELAPRGVTVSFTETVLPEDLMAQSNLIRFNGVPLEELLENASASENSCSSCSCLTGSDTNCRTVVYGGTVHEDIPPELIRQAAMNALGLTSP
jgi:hypothetical protein